MKPETIITTTNLVEQDRLATFEEVRRAEQLDESAADMLRRLYV